jgi:N-acetylglucosamine-6-sulfatase
MPTAATGAGSTAEMRAQGGSDGPRARPLVAVVLALLACVAAAEASTTDATLDRRPNVLLIITDDQPWDTLPVTVGPAAMPWLEARLDDPSDRWIRFTNAFVNVPLCCPSRASILTGRYARHTGVESNVDGADLDESSTLATWLDDAGYQTAFIGKYLNGYPWDRGAYVPAGWDRFLAKRNRDITTTYEGYPFVDQGVPLIAGTSEDAYATAMLAGEAASFLRGASAGAPWFLVFAPSAPHEPWTPAAQDVGSFDDVPIAMPDERAMNHVVGAPDWVNGLPAIDATMADDLEQERRHMLETLRGVDRAVASLVAEVRARGEMDDTLIVVISDNGFSFGEHRWVGKRCPYAACVRVPLVMRTPWAAAGEIETPVTNVGLTPTILDVAGVDAAGGRSDGLSLRPMLDDRVGGVIDRAAVLVEWAGDGEVPAWRGVRTAGFSYVEHADGTVELFDLVGTLGRPDPAELRNRADDPAYASLRRTLATSLAVLLEDDLRSAVP